MKNTFEDIVVFVLSILFLIIIMLPVMSLLTLSLLIGMPVAFIIYTGISITYLIKSPKRKLKK